MSVGAERVPVASVRVGLPRSTSRRPAWERRYTAIVVGTDGMAAVLAAIVAYLARFSSSVTVHTNTGETTISQPGRLVYLVFSSCLPALWIAVLAAARAYDNKSFGVGSDEFARVCRAAAALTTGIAFVSYAMKLNVARGYIVLAVPLLTMLSLAARYAARKRLHKRRISGECMSNVVAVGSAPSVTELVTELRRDPQSGLRVVGVCLPEQTTRNGAFLGLPMLGGPDDVLAAVMSTSADTVAVTASPDMNSTRLRHMAWQLERAEIDLVVAPGLMEVAGPRLHIRPVTGLPLLHVEEPEFSGVRRIVKGAIDWFGALLALTLLAPLMVMIACLIRLTSRGPVFFKQVRIGRDGHAFHMLKFRTMVLDAETRKHELAELNERAEGPLFKVRNDPRITPLGRILRRYSLDELPQLANVLTGAMSLVGPRPPLPSEVARYSPDAHRRLLVKPGLTGLWQINGRSDLTWDESVRLDLRYVENWSLMLDVLILWKTAFAVVRGSGAY